MLFSVNLMTFMCAETRDQAFKMATGLPIWLFGVWLFGCSVVRLLLLLFVPLLLLFDDRLDVFAIVCLVRWPGQLA